MTFKNQKELFNHIWETRPHISDLTDEQLLPKGHYLWYNQFLHVLGKGTYKHYKLNPDNIMLALPDEHARQEEYPKFKEKQDKLRVEYWEKYDNIKQIK
jgi:hypothetical protein